MKKRIIEGNYQGVSFRGRDLSGCILRGNFTGADFTDAVLIGADMSEAITQDALFAGADFGDIVVPYPTMQRRGS